MVHSGMFRFDFSHFSKLSKDELKQVELFVNERIREQLDLVEQRNIPYKNAKIIAANPIDRMMNYSGSGQPFPSSEIAFENTPNIYKINEATFNIEFKYPNSYYMPNGRDKIPPTIKTWDVNFR